MGEGGLTSKKSKKSKVQKIFTTWYFGESYESESKQILKIKIWSKKFSKSQAGGPTGKNTKFENKFKTSFPCELCDSK